MGVPHLPRAKLARRFPVHVTWQMRPELPSLRTRRCLVVLRRAMYEGAHRFGFRLVHYAVAGHQLHLLVEATDRRALARGMQGLGVRIARALNRVSGRHGRVVSDRYRARPLETPAALRRARHDLGVTARPRRRAPGRDRFASTRPLVTPRTRLLIRLRP